MSLNLDYANAHRVLLPDVDQVTLIVVGCGGTGSWLAASVARVGLLLEHRLGRKAKIFFFDDDVVEEKNVFRQCFAWCDVGENKAEVLAFRYGLSWGLEITAVPQRFTAELLYQVRGHSNDFTVTIGCVDNAEARQEILKATRGYRRRDYYNWWLDTGNWQSSGQVLIGCTDNVPREALALPGYCTALPMPSVQHPELLDPEAAEPKSNDQPTGSCAELALLGDQGFAINQRLAAEAGDYLARLLLTGDLRKMASYIDLQAGVSQSVYITPENVFRKSNHQTK